MRNLKLTLAYDGTNYCGWQIQPDQPTVQSELEQALQQVTGTFIRVAGSSRTDSGVHAIGQVVSLRADTRLTAAELGRALNATLPADIRVVGAEEKGDDFHALKSTRSKRYRYTIDNGRVRDPFSRQYAWHIPRPLDVEAMARAGQTLIGTHDFSSFETTGAPRDSSVRTVTDLTIERGIEHAQGQGMERQKIILEIQANGFLYNMVRAITGTLVEVGKGAQSESWPAEVLAAQDRAKAGPTAPPEGLVLLWVHYE